MEYIPNTKEEQHQMLVPGFAKLPHHVRRQSLVDVESVHCGTQRLRQRCHGQAA